LRTVRRKLVAGNWKMNKLRVDAYVLVEELVRSEKSFGKTEVVICPPHVHLDMAVSMTRGTSVVVGAQNASFESSGAYTGETSPAMLKDLGCVYVILGHSERRIYFGESSRLVNKKLRRSIESGLLPIYCVGETLEQRRAGAAFEVLGEQVVYGLEGIDTGDLAGMVIAYEPVWAIGTGVSAATEQAQEAHRFIRGAVERFAGCEAASGMRVIYGGSVTPENAEALIGQPDIDGALVGGASLKADAFTGIVRAAERAYGAAAG
jgi:triosephosphate isomerase (TIM)